MQTGNLGEFFTALAMASAMTATLSFFFAEKNRNNVSELQSWEKLASASFITHIISVLGIIATLFYLIYTHDYRYHYVWSHSSNELPVYYMISCFWEGQEGSFLLWIFWHAILGGILLRNKTEWRNLVLSVIASVQMILCTMILGVYFGATWVKGMYLVMLILPVFAFAKSLFGQNKVEMDLLPFKGTFHLASLILPIVSVLLVFRKQTGFFSNWSLSFSNVNNLIFFLYLLAILGYFVFYILMVRAKNTETEDSNVQKISLLEIFAGVGVLTMAVVTAIFELNDWKLGSTPFMDLKSAMPDEKIWTTNPNFIPTNGSGLNPLLQNYWMVIHPPTLFLGFASTIVPFAYVIAGLIKGKYTEWIAEVRPWSLFSAMILGIGIIMGGYWAYETLNFGGYWNWDPVENASLVPWLTGVAALHTMLLYQKSKSYLKLSMIMIISTFLLVLYSTFLTRSGILGDSSVHTFTDLGLSGQLLVLVFAYVIPVVLLLALRWKNIPQKEDTNSIWTAEFFLFLGVLVFIFASVEITFTTSLPVINKIFGTHLAPPAKLQLFYYKWNVWFSIAFGIFVAIAQFLWWKNIKKESLSNVIYRPFLIASIAACICIVATALGGMNFVYDAEFAKYAEEGFLAAYIIRPILSFSDELMLFTGLFAVAASLDIVIDFLRKNRQNFKLMGGTVTHIGFALMLIGILYSSGFESIVSKNLTPEELKGFKGDEQNDNVLLPLNVTRTVPNYFVTYKGRRRATAPIQDLAILEQTGEMFKLKFKDAGGETFALPLPLQMFQKTAQPQGSDNQPIHKMANEKESIDLSVVKTFVENNLRDLDPKLINNRTIFQVEFQSIKDTSKKFMLYPESELNEEMGGLQSHPSRKIYLGRDIYTFVSSVPNPKETEPKYEHHDFVMKPNVDTMKLGNTAFVVTGVEDLSKHPDAKELMVAVAAQIVVINGGKVYPAKPVYTIDNKRVPGMIPAEVPELGLTFAFVNVEPQKGSLTIQVQEQKNAGNDYVVLKAIEKPFINILWLGTFILSFGFGMAIVRRAKEKRK